MKDGQLLHRVTTMYERQMRQLWTGQIRTAERVRKAVNADGTINAAALRTTVIFDIPPFEVTGALAVGTDVAQTRRVPQAGTLRLVEARVKTAPVGSEATFALVVDGVVSASVSIENGTTSGSSSISVPVTAGQVLTLNATAVGTTTPAADLSVSVTYSPS